MGLFSKLRKSAPPPPSPEPTPSAEDEKPSLTSPNASVQALVPLSLDAVDVMADMIYRNCWPLGWFAPPVEAEKWLDQVVTGVCLRSKHGSVRSCPSEHPGFATFEEAVVKLNARVAIKLQSKSVEVAMRNFIDVNPEMQQLNIDADNRIQVLDTIEGIASARKNQYAAFVRDEGVLVVWADTVDQVVPSAKAIEASLVAFLWQEETDEYSQTPVLGKNGISSPSSWTMASKSTLALGPGPGGKTSLMSPSSGDVAEATGRFPDAPRVPDLDEKNEGRTDVDVEDPHKAEMLANRKLRPVTLISPFVSGLAVALAIALMCLGLRSLLIRYMYDGNAMRLALIAVLFPLALLCAFPCNVVVSSLLSLFGPVSQYHQNSAFYSAIPPSREYATDLVPITVQMPVYKESLESVIVPTIESLKKAITTFERQGGSVNVVVCDDGLQLISDEDRQRRIDYYSMNNLAYVSRPPHGKDGFQRKGRFKKAGNLNFCNTLSLRVEDLMDDLREGMMEAEGKGLESWSEMDEKGLYELALGRAVEESEGKAWAAGNIRIGEIVLLIDSDTRVPEDCFMDAALEMQHSPNVAIIQHASGVMQVANHFFENGMAFFTRILQVGISFMVANGDVAPFVGHNAFLRWSALQECAQPDPDDGVPRIWSESHVSEDFQIALILQSNGWMLRWATYSNLEFEEGVSLSAIDEMARWQKYSYGCSEIIFNPLRYWFTRGGPFTKLFRTFLWSPIPPHAKWSIIAYMFSYYAISLAWCLSLVNFVLIGSLAVQDTFYVTSWQVFFACLLLFQGLNNIAACILRYRLKLEKAGRMALDQFRWIPYFTVFFTGLSFKVACSLLAHLFSINVTWTSTSKEVQKSNFFLQVPMIFKQFYGQITLSIVVLAGMIVSTTSVMPHTYRVYSSEAIVPLAITYACHLIWPFVLDPYFTTFTPLTKAVSKAIAATTNPDRVEAPVTFKAYLLCVFASFGGIFFGFDSGYMNGVLGMEYFITLHTGLDKATTPAADFTLPTWQKSLITSVLSAGTFFGALIAGDLADNIGRRWTIISGCMVFIVGCILQTASSDGLGLIVSGRLISGFGVGFVSAIIILYMSEVAPRKVRGAIVSGYQFCITIGILLASCVCYATQERQDTGSYRIPIAIQFLWALILAVGLFLLPESPRYFVKRGRVDAAAASLARIRGQPQDSAYIQEELAEIIANHEYETELIPQGNYFDSWAACFTGGLRNPGSNLRRTILGTSIQMMQQWTGVNFIFYFGTTFFQSLGTISNPFLISLITTLVNVCSTPISFYTIEKFGRRPLLIIGAIGMFVCEFICAIIGVTDGDNPAAVKAQISLICIYIFWFASTWGPGAWVVIGEIFPIPIRSRGVGLSTASNWLWNCIITVITPYMVGTDKGNLGSKVFFIWGSTCVLCAIYAYLLVWETKGLTLEQVDRMMEETQSPRRSAAWKPNSTYAGDMGLTEGGKLPLDGSHGHHGAGEKAHIAEGTAHLNNSDVPTAPGAPVTADGGRSAV